MLNKFIFKIIKSFKIVHKKELDIKRGQLESYWVADPLCRLAWILCCRPPKEYSTSLLQSKPTYKTHCSASPAPFYILPSLEWVHFVHVPFIYNTFTVHNWDRKLSLGPWWAGLTLRALNTIYVLMRHILLHVLLHYKIYQKSHW